MLSLSSRAHYAALALQFLAKHHDPNGLVKSVEIARAQSIPQNYLEQLMSQLRRAHLVISHRGVAGGYRLARDAKTITLLEIIEAVEGPVQLRPETLSPLTSTWQMISEKISQAFDLSLADLAAQLDDPGEHAFQI